MVYFSFHSEHTTWCSWSFISSMILYSSECEFWYMITCSTLVSLLESSSLLRNILFFIMHRRCTWVITSFSYLSSGRRACSNLLLYHKMYASLIVSHIWAWETSSLIRNILLLYIIDVTLVLVHHRCNQVCAFTFVFSIEWYSVSFTWHYHILWSKHI